MRSACGVSGLVKVNQGKAIAMAQRGAALDRVRYTAAQSARVAWYSAHYLLARRLSKPFDRPGEPKFKPQAAPGQVSRIRDSFFDVFAQDRANIEAGLYPAPHEIGVAQALAGIVHSQRFFQDLPKVDARRVARQGVEVRQAVEPGRYPAYYTQNFHYQSDGWLSRDSAELYDTQVEVLFAGAADAMRRISLGELARWMRGKDQRHTLMLDLACGNGRFLMQTLQAFPRLAATGIDLSPDYAGVARDRLARWRQVEIVTGAAEATPFADARFDVATCIYLFHELPPRVRRDVARELARIIRPGGALIFADSIQASDNPDLEQMLEYFPVGFHEPFYRSYQGEDLTALFAEAGFALRETKVAFLTKTMRFERLG
jgi:ubiquinone/menaquinone biosynthesis C-methylase UbiE